MVELNFLLNRNHGTGYTSCVKAEQQAAECSEHGRHVHCTGYSSFAQWTVFLVSVHFVDKLHLVCLPADESAQKKNIIGKNGVRK
ncbi:hypothetical protein T08_8676 [Trichinella sp. T8]|nr:hypothetical protein T08_8676 [Trichinella sp. T8]